MSASPAPQREVVDQPGAALVRGVDHLEPGDRQHRQQQHDRDEADGDESYDHGDDNGTHVRRIS
ncbi:hypothetical protein LH612_33350, partial [Klebsiella pneumoniae]|nr:hypothetical protein [Klebsiella pneumoniae]